MSDPEQIRNPYPPNRRASTWQCRACGYKPNFRDNCTNCGRDWFGTEPAVAPSEEDKPHRPGLRGG